MHQHHDWQSQDHTQATSSDKNLKRDRGLGLARKRYGKQIGQKEWLKLKASGSEETGEIMSKLLQRDREASLRYRTRRRLEKDPHNKKALLVMQVKGWTREDLAIHRDSQKEKGSKMTFERRKAIIKQIAMLRNDIDRFQDENKLMDTDRFSRQRRKNQRKDNQGESDQQIRDNQEAEILIAMIKETRQIFRKGPGDPRLIKRVEDINEWLKQNMQSQYRKVVISEISTLSMNHDENAVNYSADTFTSLTSKSRKGVSRQNQDQLMTQIFGHEDDDER